MKIARILDREQNGFGLEYDNTLGKRNTMQLEAQTYERAIREAKAFLGINADDLDSDGNRWEVE